MREPTEPNFDDFLADAVAKEEEKDFNDIAQEQIFKVCDVLLERHSVPTHVRLSGDRRNALRDELHSIMFDATIDHMHDQGKFDIDAEQASINIEAKLTEIEIDDMVLLTQMAMLVRLHQIHGDMAKATLNKKQLMADMLVGRSIAKDSEWMRFADELLPGEALDTDSIDDLMIVAESQKAADENRDQKLKIHDFHKSYMLRMLSPESSDEERIAFEQWFVDCITLYGQQSSSSDAEKSAGLDKVAREHGVSREVTEELVAGMAQFNSHSN